MKQYYKQRKFTSAGIAISMVTICAISILPCRSIGAGPDDQAKTTESARYENLRGVYLGKKHGVQQKSPVGRLSLHKLENDSVREVRFDHRFRSHDKFRIAISSNRNGYVYIQHRSPGGKLQLLWPPEQPVAKWQVPVQNEIRPGDIYLIPPKPDAFIFDEETGAEILHIIISSKPEPPPFSTNDSFADESQQIATGRSLKIGKEPIIEVLVSGSQRGGLDRGIKYVPRTKDSDPNIYFSANPGVAADSIMLKFQLSHE